MTTTHGRGDKNGEKSLDPSILANGERYALESQVRECYGRCAYTHKTHERMAERCSKRFRQIKIVQIVLAALTTAGAVGILFEKGSSYATYATLFLSVTMLVVNSYLKDLDPGQAAQKHREAASDIWNIRESYMSLLIDIRDPNVALDDLRRRRDDLQEKLYKLYRAAPNTDGKAYGEAQDRLKNKEDLTFSEAEIDALLPRSLRRRPYVTEDAKQRS
jgi:hypothetical protein